MTTLPKKLIIGLIALLLVLGGGGYYYLFYAKQKAISAVAWQTHLNKDYKFQLAYPADWVIIDGSSMQGDKQFRGVALEGPIHKDFPGYENQEVRYLLILEFKDSFVADEVKPQFNGFALKKEPGEVRPKLANIANVEKTPEYQAAQKIIDSFKDLP